MTWNNTSRRFGSAYPRASPIFNFTRFDSRKHAVPASRPKNQKPRTTNNEHMRLKVRLASGDEPQRRVRRRLFQILGSYKEVSDWFFTNEVLIDDSKDSHSHPVLTIGSAGIGIQTDLGLLSTFIHEQFHWHLSQHPERVKLAIDDLKTRYLHVNVGTENGGARNEESTYLHLLVCFLEAEALSLMVGRKRAMGFILRKPYYFWVYKKVASDHEVLATILARRGLDSTQIEPLRHKLY